MRSAGSCQLVKREALGQDFGPLPGNGRAVSLQKAAECWFGVVRRFFLPVEVAHC